jgi:hypothetical protein
LCAEHAPKGVLGHVEGKCPPAVDLDHRQELSVAPLEVGNAADIDLAELEVHIGPDHCNRRPRPLAQVAPLRAVQGDLGRYG